MKRRADLARKARELLALGVPGWVADAAHAHTQQFRQALDRVQRVAAEELSCSQADAALHAYRALHSAPPAGSAS